MAEEHKEQNTRKLPIMNNAIPGLEPRSLTWIQSNKTLLGIITGASVLAVPIAVIDHAYKQQAHEIHRQYEMYVPKAIRESTFPLTVNEELKYLQNQGYAPKSWAVELFENLGSNLYVTKDGFRRKIEPRK